MQLLLFQLFIRYVVEWAHFDTYRAAIIFAEIGETQLVLYISASTIFVDFRFPVKSPRWAFLDANPAGGTVVLNPGVIVSFVEREIINAGEDCCQPYTGSMLRCYDDAIEAHPSQTGFLGHRWVKR